MELSGLPASRLKAVNSPLLSPRRRRRRRPTLSLLATTPGASEVITALKSHPPTLSSRQTQIFPVPMEPADTADRDDERAACCSFSSLPPPLLLHLVSDTPHHKTLHGTSRPLHNEVLMETVYHQTVIVCFSTATHLKDIFFMNGWETDKLLN